MSFASSVRTELAGHIPDKSHCRGAELAGILLLCGSLREDGALCIRTEKIDVARKCFTLIRKSFNIIADVSIRTQEGSRRRLYTLTLWQGRQVISGLPGMDPEDGSVRLLPKKTCCVRAFLRGAYLAGGTVSDPKRSYHLEIVCQEKEKAQMISEGMARFDLEGRIAFRKHHYIVYIKDSTQIVDMLNIMEAHSAMMEMENVRILKEMNNSVNRQVNCEMANINKIVTASGRQIADIRLIQETVGLDSLSESLRETALLRLNWSEASLEDLGAMLTPPVGKSGMNHRLRKLSQIAGQIRKERC